MTCGLPNSLRFKTGIKLTGVIYARAAQIKDCKKLIWVLIVSERDGEVPGKFDTRAHGVYKPRPHGYVQ